MGGVGGGWRGVGGLKSWKKVLRNMGMFPKITFRLDVAHCGNRNSQIRNIIRHCASVESYKRAPHLRAIELAPRCAPAWYCRIAVVSRSLEH